MGPVDVKFDHTGSHVAVSSMDNSVKVYSLHETAEGSKAVLECEAPGEVADAWKLDFSSDSETVLTGMFQLHELERKDAVGD